MNEKVSNSFSLNLEAPSNTIIDKATILTILIKIGGKLKTLVSLKMLWSKRPNKTNSKTLLVLNFFERRVAKSPNKKRSDKEVK